MNRKRIKRSMVIFTVLAMLVSLFPALVLASTEKPTLSNIEVSADLKTIYVYSDVDLKSGTDQIDKTKVKLTAGGRSVAASNLQVTVENSKTVKIVSKMALSGTNNKIQLDPGLVLSDASSLTNHALTDQALTIGKSPSKVKSATLDGSNKILSIELDVTGLTSPTIAAGNRFAALKDAVKIANNGNIRTATALGTDDSVSYNNTDKKLTVTFANALTSSKARVVVSAGALALTAGSNNKLLTPELSTAPLDLFPVVTSTTLSANKKVTLKYSELIKNGTADTAKETTNLKSAITFAANGTSFLPLGSSDSIALTKDSLTITFNTAIAGTTNKVKVNANAIADMRGNKTAEFTTDSIVADVLGPQITTIQLVTENVVKRATLNFIFNENIVIPADKINALKSCISFKSKNGSIYTSYASTPVTLRALVRGNVLNVSHVITDSNIYVGDTDHIRLEDGCVTDESGNPNDREMTTDISADSTAPTPSFVPYTLSNSNKTVTIHFDGPVYSTSKLQDAASVERALKSAIRHTRDALTSSGLKVTLLSNKVMSAVTVTLTPGSTTSTLVIDNLPEAFTTSHKFTIDRGALVDLAGNKSDKLDVAFNSETPIVTINTPNNLPDSVQPSFQTNISGTYYFVIYSDAEPAPTVEDIITPTEKAVASGNHKLVKNIMTPHPTTVTGLTPSSTYKIYVAFETVYGITSTSPTSVTYFTSSVPD